MYSPVSLKYSCFASHFSHNSGGIFPKTMTCAAVISSTLAKKGSNRRLSVKISHMVHANDQMSWEKEMGCFAGPKRTSGGRMALAQFRLYRFSAKGENDSPKSVSRSWASEGVYSGHFFPSHIGLVVSWGALDVSGFLSRRMMGNGLGGSYFS